MITQTDIEDKLKALKPYLHEKYSVGQIGYFGSFARGDFHEDSDIDILVEFDGIVGWKFFDLQEFLEKELGKKVDLVTENSIRKKWKDSILSQVKFL